MAEDVPVRSHPARPTARPALALVLIGIGFFALMGNFGLLAGSVWPLLARFWPLVLVLWGLQLVFGGSRFGSFLVFVVGLLALAALVFAVSVPGARYLSDAGVLPDPQAPVAPVTASLPGPANSLTSRSLSVTNGVGTVRLDDAGDQLVEIQSTNAAGVEPKLEQREENGRAVIEVTTQQDRFMSVGPAPEYRVSLGRHELPTDISIKSGAGTVNVEPGALSVDSLRVELGTGTLETKLSEASVPKTSELSVGAGTIKVWVPGSIGMRISYQVGLGSVSVGSDTLKGSGTYETPGYADAASRMDLKVHVGTGSVEVAR